jgi:hypothetical protein
MEESAGSADAEMSVVEKSISFKINALQQEWVGMAQSLIDRGDLGTVIDTLTKLSEALGWVVDKAGLLGTIGLGAGLFTGIKNVGNVHKRVHSNICFEYAYHA